MKGDVWKIRMKNHCRVILPYHSTVRTYNSHLFVLVTYLHLEDLAKGFKGPCVADIKIGRITYDPDATPKKRATEEAKYPPQKVLGFQFRGMRVRNNLINAQFVFLDIFKFFFMLI